MIVSQNDIFKLIKPSDAEKAKGKTLAQSLWKIAVPLRVGMYGIYHMVSGAAFGSNSLTTTVSWRFTNVRVDNADHWSERAYSYATPDVTVSNSYKPDDARYIASITSSWVMILDQDEHFTLSEIFWLGEREDRTANQEHLKRWLKFLYGTESDRMLKFLKELSVSRISRTDSNW